MARKPTRFKITDTITYQRTWYVYARNEDAAFDLACDGPGDAEVEEEQIDNTPYEVEEDPE